jgi:spoIIIJ-associated protein
LTATGGRGLDALQYLCNRVLNRRLSDHRPVHLDCDGFKARRAHKLQERAEAAADEALRRGAPVTLGPLTPAARREIHLALADDPGVETESDGEGFLKRIVIRPRRRR